MTHPIANAPCSWGVDDPKNPDLPAWATVLKEAAQAGYRSVLTPKSWTVKHEAHRSGFDIQLDSDLLISG